MKNKIVAIVLAITMYVPVIALVYSQFFNVNYDGNIWNAMCIAGVIGVVFIVPLAVIRLLRS